MNLMRTTAFFTRSVRQDSRLISHHLLRAGMTTAILVLFWWQMESYGMQSSSGGEFASLVLIACYWFVTLAGIVHFSTAITEEKEEQTLPLLRMTGAGPVSILLGKTGPRLTAISLFLLVGSPFLVLAISLGGILTVGILSAMFALLAYTLALSQIGALASVVCRNGKNAITLASLLWAFVELNPLFYSIAVEIIPSRSTFGEYLHGPLSSIPNYSLLYNLSSTLYTVSDAVATDAGIPGIAQHYFSRLFSNRVCFQLVFAVCLFALSWCLFDRFSDRHAVPVTKSVRDRKTSGGRVHQQALAWKTYQHITGGTIWLGIRIVVPLLVIYGTLIGGQILSDFGPIEWQETHKTAFWLGGLLFFFNATRLSGRLLTSEMSEKTLASLMLLPGSTPELLLKMALGLLPAIVAGGSTMMISTFCRMATDSSFELLELLIEPAFYVPWAALAVILHLQVLFSTWFRYGSMPLATFIVVTVYILVLMLAASGGGDGEFMRIALPLGLLVSSTLACALFQRAIIARVDELVS